MVVSIAEKVISMEITVIKVKIKEKTMMKDTYIVEVMVF